MLLEYADLVISRLTEMEPSNCSLENKIPLSTQKHVRQQELDLNQLDEVPAGIIKESNGDRSHWCWLPNPHHSPLFQPLVLALNIRNRKCCCRNPLLKQGCL